VTERLGPPPHDLKERELPIVRLEGPWLRLHAAGREPVFFGRMGLNRFDDPEGEYGVLYVGFISISIFSHDANPGRHPQPAGHAQLRRS
jgi:hypothetical protein